MQDLDLEMSLPKSFELKWIENGKISGRKSKTYK